MPTVATPIVDLFDADDWAKFMVHVAAVSPDHEMLFVLALDSFCRVGELHALKWGDINVTTGQLSVNKTMIHAPGGETLQLSTKTDASRTLTLTPATLAHLAEWRIGRTDDRASFIFSKHGTQPWSMSRTMNRYKAYQLEAGVALTQKPGAKAGSMGTMRHVGITTWLLRGAPMLMVAQRAGNSPMSIARHYAGHIVGGDAAFAAMM